MESKVEDNDRKAYKGAHPSDILIVITYHETSTRTEVLRVPHFTFGYIAVSTHVYLYVYICVLREHSIIDFEYMQHMHIYIYIYIYVS